MKEKIIATIGEPIDIKRGGPHTPRDTSYESIEERYPEEVLRERYNVDALIKGFESTSATNVKEKVLLSLRNRAEREDEKKLQNSNNKE